MKIYKCNKCGSVVELLDGKASLVCCGEEMVELKANTSDAAKEKHVPFCEIEEDMVIVKVGETIHPMDNDHYIMWIMCEYKDSTVKYDLKPGDEPTAYFDYEKGMTVYAYCNKHGLWKKQI